MRYRLLFAVSGIAAALAISGCQHEQGKAAGAPPGDGGADAQKPAASPTQTPPPSSAPPSSKPGSVAHPPDAGPVTADLTVTFKKGESSAAQTWTLTCGPVGGDYPKAKDACAALASVDQPFAPAPKGSCTMIFGGPETARVTGTWQGQKVDTTFSRKDGCELNRWTKMQEFLPDVPRVR